MAINMELIKELRAKTGAGVMDAKVALEEANGDMAQAEEWLKQKGINSAAKKSDRVTKQGLIDAYIHNGRIGVMIEVNCETDFVARTDDFKQLCHDLALQVASMNPESVEALLDQEFIKNPSTKIVDLVKSAIAKVGENIVVARFTRFELGEA
jgi:elongation factor Ts